MWNYCRTRLLASYVGKRINLISLSGFLIKRNLGAHKNLHVYTWKLSPKNSILTLSLKSHKQLHLSNKMFISSSRALVSLKQHLSPRISDLLWLIFYGAGVWSNILYCTSITWNTHLNMRDPIYRRSPPRGLSSRTTSWFGKQDLGLFH